MKTVMTSVILPNRLKDLKYIIDCDKNKRPTTKGWTTIKEDWESKKYTNGHFCGILCNHLNNIEVLDLDVIKKTDNPGLISGVEWFEENIGPILEQDTFIVKTPSKGYHLYYTYDQTLPFKNSSQLVKNVKIDWRGKGKGQVCFGDGYEVVKDSEIKKLPSEHREIISKFYADREKKTKKVSQSDLSYVLENQGLKARAENEQEWIETCWAIFNVCCENGLDGVHNCIEFSKNSTKFDEEAGEKIKKLKYKQGGLGWASLLSWKSRSQDVAPDRRVAEYVFSKNEELIKSTPNGIYIKSCHNLWINDPSKHSGMLNVMITNSDYTLGKEEEEIGALTKNWSNWRTQINAIIDKLPINTDFNPDNYIGIIPFNDGVWDFSESNFISYKDRDYELTKKSFINFPRNYDKKLMEELQIIIGNTFKGQEEEGKELMKYLCRSLAGYYKDKYWCIGIGNRNSGKGLIQGLFEKTFPELVGNFSPDCLVCKDDATESEERQNSWKEPFVTKNLVFGSELKSQKALNGTIIKGIASGGDPITYRAAYGKTQQGITKGAMVIFLNDFGDVKPSDCLSNLLYFEFKNQFVDEEELKIPSNSYIKKQLKDDSVKSWIDKPGAKECFIHYVIQQFGTPDYPILKENTKLLKNVEVNLEDQDEKFLDLFVITGSLDDYVLCSEMENIRSKNNITISMKKLTPLLRNKGVDIKGKKIDRKQCKVYVGIKTKTQIIE